MEEHEDTQNNIERQNDELLVLKAVYGEDSVEEFESNLPRHNSSFVFYLKLSDIPVVAPIQFSYPTEYPSLKAPTYELLDVVEEYPENSDGSTDKSARKRAFFRLTYSNVMLTEIKSIFTQTWEEEYRGEVVILAWVEKLHEYLSHKWGESYKELLSEAEIRDKPADENQKEKQEGNDIIKAEQTNKLSTSTKDKVETALCPYHDSCSQIFQGPVFEEKKSVFIGFLTKVHSETDVDCFRRRLLMDKKIAKATHNILAYRIKNKNGFYLQDNDDDGETAAGKRLQMLLVNTGVENVAVIVSRWYGGVLLGPERFKLINNAARAVLESSGHLKGS
ncbi:Protein IMPACT-B [Zancudomyces culisetae]|uniref:Protein IMPACT-B n=1 Tax=Zancudomyces culisetae TaxID=1213189 RepID=A0A1R1PJP5_ZANCU|nr:Protein IMPACT-B [Zancudomyces culisetae]|eukprot:OMH81143.1 Protein IMPACT-B [Zancudomyces culisetae]